MDTRTPLTVGVLQTPASDDTPDERFAVLATAFDKAAARQCDLLICPELFLSGYFAGERLAAVAEPQDGPFARRVLALAAHHGCAIVYGYPERAPDGLYNAALCAGPDGRVLANHRKALLPHEYEEQHFRCGTEPTAFSLAGWRIGLVICYELEMPEPARLHARAGCDLIVAPTALTAEWSVVARKVVPARAFENTVFVAYTNHAGHEGGCQYLGESVIVSPYGEDLARAGSNAGLITATLEPDTLIAARSRLHSLRDAGAPPYG